MACSENNAVRDASKLLLERAQRLESMRHKLLGDLGRSLRDSERCLQRFGSRSPSLAHSVEGRLQSSPFLPLRYITCEDDDGRVILRGRVPTQYLHALAGSVAKSFGGDLGVTNKIEVIPLGQPYAPAALYDA